MPRGAAQHTVRVGYRIAGETHDPDAARGVDVRGNGHVDVVVRRDHEVVAAGHEEEIGEAGTEHDARSVVEPDRTAHRSVGESGEQLGPLGVGAREVDDGGRPHRGEERARGDRGAHRLEHDRELGEPEPGAAMLLGEVQTQPPEVGELLPRRRQPLLGSVEQGARLLAGGDALQGAGGHAGQLEMVIGDRDRHGFLHVGVRRQRRRARGGRFPGGWWAIATSSRGRVVPGTRRGPRRRRRRCAAARCSPVRCGSPP